MLGRAAGGKGDGLLGFDGSSLTTTESGERAEQPGRSEQGHPSGLPPAPPSPKQRLLSGLSFCRTIRAPMSFPRTSTGWPRSSSTTGIPASATSRAAKRPAGPLPTTTTGSRFPAGARGRERLPEAAAVAEEEAPVTSRRSVRSTRPVSSQILHPGYLEGVSSADRQLDGPAHARALHPFGINNSPGGDGHPVLPSYACTDQGRAADVDHVGEGGPHGPVPPRVERLANKLQG